MSDKVTKLPWVDSIGDGYVQLTRSEFEELRDWSFRIHAGFRLMVDENVRLNTELRKIKQRVEE